MTQAAIILLPIQYAIGIVTYYQFILEETIQTGLMGCYIGNKVGYPSIMDKVIERLDSVTLPALHDYTNKYGFIAYFHRDAFDCFWKAGKLAISAYKECR
jgi:hypothetical protein